MARNVEIKVKIDDQQEQSIEAYAAKVGKGPQLLQQTDTFFHTADGRLKLREFADGSAELISYERDNLAEPRLSNYLRFEVEKPEEMKSMLSRSVGIVCVVKKNRKVYLIDQARIHLDDVELLGKFLEIEVVLRSDQIEEVGNDIMESLLDQLQIDPSQFQSDAYADMILALS